LEEEISGRQVSQTKKSIKKQKKKNEEETNGGKKRRKGSGKGNEGKMRYQAGALQGIGA
jgi:hypothetical protein